MWAWGRLDGVAQPTFGSAWVQPMAEHHVGCRYANAEVTSVVCVDGCGVAGPTMIDEIEPLGIL